MTLAYSKGSCLEGATVSRLSLVPPLFLQHQVSLPNSPKPCGVEGKDGGVEHLSDVRICRRLRSPEKTLYMYFSLCTLSALAHMHPPPIPACSWGAGDNSRRLG